MGIKDYFNDFIMDKNDMAKAECKVNIAKVKHDHKEEEYP